MSGRYAFRGGSEPWATETPAGGDPGDYPREDSAWPDGGSPGQEVASEPVRVPAFGDMTMVAKAQHMAIMHGIASALRTNRAHTEDHAAREHGHVHEAPRRALPFGRMDLEARERHMKVGHGIDIPHDETYARLSYGSVMRQLLALHNRVHRARQVRDRHYHDIPDEEVVWQTDVRNPAFMPEEYWTRDEFM